MDPWLLKKYILLVHGESKGAMDYLDGTTQRSISLPKGFHGVIHKPLVFQDADQALEYVCKIYNNHVTQLKLLANSEIEFVHNITYPYVGIYVPTDQDGVLKGYYGTTISHPEVLYDYYYEQFRVITEEHRVPIWIGHSTYPMSLVFIDEDLFNGLAVTKKLCPSYLPCMRRIQQGLHSSEIRPLSAFHGERTGYSLNRLHHYLSLIHI